MRIRTAVLAVLTFAVAAASAGCYHRPYYRRGYGYGPQPVYYQPAPQPVYVQPAPVYAPQPQPVYIQPAQGPVYVGQ